ncbi:MAG: Gfo/Idh/MocA family oxidoreductase [Rhodospirillales bacterium]
MNLYALLQRRLAESGKPVGVGLIGAGKFGSMFLAQVPKTRGLRLAALADLDEARAETALKVTGWSDEARAAVAIGADSLDLIARDDVEVVIDACGNPAAGIRHALAAAKNGKHIVMVNVEADVLAGPLLAETCRKAGVVYSMAYGDQPALVAEMVDWARACGLSVVAAGKGTKYLPEYHASTPDSVWTYYGLTPKQAAEAGMNPQMFNSFLDGTKSAIEMAAIANATGLTPPDGLAFPPAGVDDLPHVLRPHSEGGQLSVKGQVEVVSSLERDGRPVFRDLRWGVYVVFEGGEGIGGDYTNACFRQYGLVTDASGRYAALYKPYHLIGLELGISVLSAALRGEPTGETLDFRGDVAATAKRDLQAGETLDGEGGHCVWGRLLPAETSLARGCLPIGLAHGVRLKRPIAAGETVGWADVEIGDNDETVRVRREMEARFQGKAAAAE